MAKIWRLFQGEFCKYCDSPTLISAEQSLDNGFGHDGDSIMCMKCEAKGRFTVVDGEMNKIDWDEIKRIPDVVPVFFVAAMLLILCVFGAWAILL